MNETDRLRRRSRIMAFALRKGWVAADDTCRARLAANGAELMLQHRPVAEEPRGVPRPAPLGHRGGR